ncbi:MAG: hypothetical protein HFE83_06610 [Lachnospiraceae bacterium]|nr:hypothetical protein [Lachnospiraceae bacterium]
MASRLVIEGNSVYEIDEECEKRQSPAVCQRQRQPQNKRCAVSQEKKDSGK